MAVCGSLSIPQLHPLRGMQTPILIRCAPSSTPARTMPSLTASYAGAVNSALDAWDIAQKQLDQLLLERIDHLGRQRLISLIVIGVLGMLGLLVALLTYRDMIVPIKRLAELANTIRETKNYGLRFNYESRDEIGGLAGAFNEMLGELSVAREREIMSQTEIARVSRLTTMGAMVASIAHEIRQPLAAVVANSHAGTRWLTREEPDLGEVRAALESIGENGHRANEVITSISAMFKKNPERRMPVDMNEVVNNVLNLSRGELRSRKITLHTKLAPDLPRVSADSVQLTEVLLNLVMNAVEAMSTTAEKLRVLAIASQLEAEGVTITVEELRRRDRRQECGANLRGLLHDQVDGHGNGACDLPVDYCRPRWTPLGVAGKFMWCDIPCRFAGRRQSGHCPPALDWLRTAAADPSKSPRCGSTCLRASGRRRR